MSKEKATWNNVMSMIADMGGANITTKIERPRVMVKYHDVKYGKRPRLQKIEKGDWVDLYTAEDIHLNVGDYRLISLGISMKLPEGYEAIVVPRSSTFARYGIIMVNSIGIIDNSYSGENDIWKFPAYALVDTDILKDTRIAQFRILRNQPNIELIETDLVDADDRGGFGSTGN